MRTLPCHKITPPLQPPLIFTGLGMYELAGWHRYYRLRADNARMKEIEAAVNLLPDVEKYYIRKLNFYQPINITQ